MSATKRCSQCREDKSLDGFHTQESSRDGRQAYCKGCTSARAKAYRSNPEIRARVLARQRQHYQENRERLVVEARRYREQNPEKVARTSRKHLLKRLYGLTPEQFAVMRDDQDGRCVICRNEAKLYVDHDHDTGAVRGLLCSDCNIGLGVFRDNPLSLARAIRYLSTPSAATPALGLTERAS